MLSTGYCYQKRPPPQSLEVSSLILYKRSKLVHLFKIFILNFEYKRVSVIKKLFPAFENEIFFPLYL